MLRRLCILPAAPTLRSDDPAIQQGVVQAVNAAETSLVLMPALSGARPAGSIWPICSTAPESTAF